MSLPVALLQLTPGDDLGRNLEAIGVGVRRAAGEGAQLVALPEFATFLHRSGRAMAAAALPEGGNPALDALVRLATACQVWLFVGSIAVRADDDSDLLSNRSFVISPDDGIIARYDKIHLFDVTLPSGRAIEESRSYRPGERAVVVPTPWGKVGLSVCYDLRFPHLYRALAQAGAEILMVPAAFSRETGPSHWKPLLQARAIETGCHVIAAATCGTHPGGWSTWGHSTLVDPWGRIGAEAGEDPAVLVASLDPAATPLARAMIPSLSGDRPFTAPA